MVAKAKRRSKLTDAQRDMCRDMYDCALRCDDTYRGCEDSADIKAPKYQVGERVWYIWTENVWTTQPCRIASVRSEEECQDGPMVTVYHYSLAFRGENQVAFEEREGNLYATRKEAQALCDDWNGMQVKDGHVPTTPLPKRFYLRRCWPKKQFPSQGAAWSGCPKSRAGRDAKALCKGCPGPVKYVRVDKEKP